MAATSRDVDERTSALLAELQQTFGVRTNSAVLRKAVALASIVSKHADAYHTITIASGNGQAPVKISLAG